MHYYPYPFKTSPDNGDARTATLDADGYIDVMIACVVGLICLGALLAIA